MNGRQTTEMNKQSMEVINSANHETTESTETTERKTLTGEFEECNGSPLGYRPSRKSTDRLHDRPPVDQGRQTNLHLKKILLLVHMKSSLWSL